MGESEQKFVKIEPRNFISFYYETNENLVKVPNKQNTALLIIDLQNEFVRADMGEAKLLKDAGDWERWKPYYKRLNEVTVPNTKKLLEYFRTEGMEVTQARIASLKKDGRDRCPVQRKPGFNNMLVPINSEGAQIIDELKPQEDEIVVTKTSDSVVTGTNYTTLLRNMGVETVVVAGIISEQCVASTVRSLADEGFNVLVAEDCCDSADRRIHDAEMEAMNVIYCEVLSSDQIMKLLDGKYC